MKSREEYNKYMCNWYHQLSPEKKAIIAKKESEYQTKHYISTYRNGKTILLKGTKRDKPKDLKCELCKRQCTKMHLQYHHYDDSNLM